VRIRNPHHSDVTQLKPALLFHGFQCSGSLWITARSGTLHTDGRYYEIDEHGKNVLMDGEIVGNTLGFVLASRGYDVWLANYRGNIYSTNHTKLDTKEEQYWNFSIDQMVDEDLPTVIEYIRTVTQKPTISYIGHSQGNFMMLSLLATQPHYSDVIKPFIALSPVVYTSQFKAILMWGYPFRKHLLSLFPRQMFTNLIKVLQMPRLCSNPILKYSICHMVYYLILGSHRDQIDFV